MKIPAGLNQWGAAILGVVCFVLVANLVTQYRGMQPGASRGHVNPGAALHARVVKSSPHGTDDLVRYDPTVNFDALKALDSRPLPDADRNPFEFVGGAPAPAPLAVARAAPQAPPPPPPPLPLKAMGYNELPGGKEEAMVTLNDDLEVVHVGDLVGGRFKVTKISPTMVVVEDGNNNHQTVELPFPAQ